MDLWLERWKIGTGKKSVHTNERDSKWKWNRGQNLIFEVFSPIFPHNMYINRKYRKRKENTRTERNRAKQSETELDQEYCLLSSEDGESCQIFWDTEWEEEESNFQVEDQSFCNSCSKEISEEDDFWKSSWFYCYSVLSWRKITQ